jgi:predicted dienelactone hydrolase
MMRILLCSALFICAIPAQADIPSKPGVDAPELAFVGPSHVGYRTLTFTHKDQPDVENADGFEAPVRLHNRILRVSIWYPAEAQEADVTPIVYRDTLWGEPPRGPVSFSQKGMAIADAVPKGRRHPFIVLSHGYSNNPAVMTWLSENLASKGYVVAAIHHQDPNPYISSATTRAAPNFNRPRDITFVTERLRADLGDQIDPDKVALIGYSQGGYGVLTAGGASLDPEGPNMTVVAGGWLKKFARGTKDAASLKVPGVKAIIALAPAGGLPKSAWGAAGLREITAPLMLIQGDQDPVVDYKSGALAVFGGAVNADRYLLTYKQAGHSIALNPVPDEMRGSLWDMDWFEDPIWRQDRINAINLHFITAFLAVHLRGDAAKQSYLDVSDPDSDKGEWNAPAGTPWGAYSPGAPEATLWKGFQRRHARGMELRHAPPAQ